MQSLSRYIEELKSGLKKHPLPRGEESVSSTPNLTPEIYFSPAHVSSAIEPEIRNINGIENPQLAVSEENGASILTVSFTKEGQPFTCRVICKKEKDGINYSLRIEFRNKKGLMFYAKGPGSRNFLEIQFALSHAFTAAFVDYHFPEQK